MFSKKVRWYTYLLTKAIGGVEQIDKDIKTYEGRELLGNFLSSYYYDILPTLKFIAQEQKNSYQKRFMSIDIHEVGTGEVIDRKYILREPGSLIVYKTPSAIRHNVKGATEYIGFTIPSSDYKFNKDTCVVTYKHEIYYLEGVKGGSQKIPAISEIRGVFKKFISKLYDSIDSFHDWSVDDMVGDALTFVLERYVPRSNVSPVAFLKGFVLWFIHSFRDIPLQAEAQYGISLSEYFTSDMGDNNGDSTVTEELVYHLSSEDYYNDYDHFGEDELSSSRLLDFSDAYGISVETIIRLAQPHKQKVLKQELKYSKYIPFF